MNDMWKEMSNKPSERIAKPKQSYEPEVDDYVIWGNFKGWVYFKDVQYITIELGVKPKPNCEYTKLERHKYIHTLLLCYPNRWNELQYVHTRKNKYGKNLEEMNVYDRFK
jgi:hypothetical protein|tara:strand:+ start:3791 stop:4120 length:330 start_codon:yes stop_codon:yes gene_type:complete